jgi:hypothetical protein
MLLGILLACIAVQILALWPSLWFELLFISFVTFVQGVGQRPYFGDTGNTGNKSLTCQAVQLACLTPAAVLFSLYIVQRNVGISGSTSKISAVLCQASLCMFALCCPWKKPLFSPGQIRSNAL